MEGIFEIAQNYVSLQNFFFYLIVKKIFSVFVNLHYI